MSSYYSSFLVMLYFTFIYIYPCFVKVFALFYSFPSVFIRFHKSSPSSDELTFSSPEYVRMPSDHLCANSVHNIVNCKVLFPLLSGCGSSPGTGDPQFLAEIFGVLIADCADYLARLFLQTGYQTLMGLTAVPGTAIFRAQRAHDFTQIFKGVFLPDSWILSMFCFYLYYSYLFLFI